MFLSRTLRFCLYSVTLSLSFSAAASPSNTTHGLAHGLQGALSAVLERHPSIQGKYAEIEAQQYNIDGAEAGRYPSISASANNVNDNYDQGVITVDQPLWTFGKIDSAIAVAVAEHNAEQVTLLQLQRDLIEQTVTAYANAHSINYKLLIAEDNIAEHQRLYDRIKRREQGKLASTADLTLAFSRLNQAKSDKQQLLGEQQTAQAQLLALTQIPVSTDQPIDPALLQLPSTEQINQQVIEHSADVALKREQIVSAQQGERQAKAAIMPTLSFRLEQDFLENQNGEHELRSGFMLEGSLDGLGFNNAAQRGAAGEQIKVAQADLDSTLNDVARRMDTLLLSREVQANLRHAQQDSINAIADTMASYLRQYETGRKSWLEVLNTQRELTELRTQLVTINNEWAILSLRIAAIIGQLDAMAGVQPLEPLEPSSLLPW